MLKFETDSFNKVFIVTVDGFIDKKDLDNYLIHLKRNLDDWGEVKEVKIIKKFDGIDFLGFCKVISFYFKNLKSFKKSVLISYNYLDGTQGLFSLFFMILGFILSFPLVCKFRRYSFKNIPKAKKWLSVENDKVKETDEHRSI